MSRIIQLWRTPMRFYSETVKSNINVTSSKPPPPKVNENVPGLSTACFNSVSGPVGPDVDLNKSGPYKAPEYYCYNNFTYYEAEVEMAKYRLPQPSSSKK